MDYRPLGRTGVMVSPLCLGTMNLGGPTGREESIAIINRALEAGINFFDTANVWRPSRPTSGVASPVTSANSLR